MSLSTELNEILSQTDKTVLTKAVKLRGQLVAVSPVDTGNLKGSWTPIEKKNEAHYVFTNTAEYASIRLAKRRRVKGKMYGSLQNPNGISPIIKKMNIEIEESLKGIK